MLRPLLSGQLFKKMYYYADIKRANIPNSLLHVFIPDCLVTPRPISDVPRLLDTGRGPTRAFYKRAPSWTQVSSRFVLIHDVSVSVYAVVVKRFWSWKIRRAYK